MQATVIKISDIIKEIGNKDKISFKGISIDGLGSLSKNGVRGNIEMLCIGSNTIFARLEDVHCEIDEISDYSGKGYKRKVDIEEYTGYFVSNVAEFDQDTEDPVFAIDMKHETIDIGELLYQAIKLYEPVIRLTEQEEKEYLQSLEDGDHDDYGETGGQVIFRKAKG